MIPPYTAEEKATLATLDDTLITVRNYLKTSLNQVNSARAAIAWIMEDKMNSRTRITGKMADVEITLGNVATSLNAAQTIDSSLP